MDFESLSAFKIPFFLLKKLGMWQDKSSSRSYRVYGLLLILVFIFIPYCCHTVYVFNLIKFGTSSVELSYGLSFLFTFYAGLLKSFCFIYKLDNIHEVLGELKILMMFSSSVLVHRRPQFKKNVQRVVRIIKIYYASAFLSVSANTFASLVHYKARSLPIETWIFWDYKSSDEVFWAVSAFQFFMSSVGITLNYSFDVVPIVFMSLTSSLLEELSTEFSTIESENGEGRREDADRLKKLKHGVERHIKIRSVAYGISKHLSFAALIQTFLSTIILCTSAFLLTTVCIIICLGLMACNLSFISRSLQAMIRQHS